MNKPEMKWKNLELSEKDKAFLDFQREVFAGTAEMLSVPVEYLGPHGPWAKSIATALGMPQEDGADRWEQECQRAKALQDLSQGRNIEEAKKILEPYRKISLD